MARREWLLLHARSLALAAAAAAALIIVIILPAYIAYSAAHPPSCGCTPTPESYGLPYVNFTARTIDGVAIRGWVVAPGNPGPVYIILHPYMGCRTEPHVLNLTLALARMGYVVAAFDFRGHGCSGGGHTTIGVEELRDAQAVVDYIYNMYPERRIYLVGFSMGAAVAVVEAAGDARVTGVVADAPYCTLRTVAERWVSTMHHLPGFMADLALFYARLMGYQIDPGYGPCMLHGVDKPLLVIHEENDPLVTRGEAERIASLSPCGKLVEVKGAGHIGAMEKLGVERYVRLVTSYLQEASSNCTAAAPAAGG